MPRTIARSRQLLPSVSALGDAATITGLNCDLGDIFDLATLSQNSTIPAPSGTPNDGQSLVLRITSSAIRTLTWDAIFSAASTLALPTATSGGGFQDAIGFRYSSLFSKWMLVAATIGDGSSITASSLLDTISATRGSVVFRGASAWSGLAPGTAGFALVTGGAGADPSYAQIPVVVDKSLRFTPSTSETGIIPVMQMVAIQSAFTLANATGVQNCLTAANDTITLSASTSYMVEGFYKIVTGATTHTTAIAFGGTATITNFEYEAMLWSAAANTISTTQSTTQVSGTASKVLNATSTAVHTMIKFKGILRVNGAGTIIPQIAFSADPTGACTMAIGSYISFTPLGTNTFAAVGNWS
jgi:hypothetical protein